MDFHLIEVVGRKDVVGKPLLFGTTDEFLKRFELDSIDNLPEYDELIERIKVLHSGENSDDDSLYGKVEFDKIEDEEENPQDEIPDFLKEEEGLQKISVDNSSVDKVSNDNSNGENTTISNG